MRAFITSQLCVCVRDCVQLSTCTLPPDVGLFDFTALPMCRGMATSYLCSDACPSVCVLTAGLAWAQCYFVDPSHLLWVRGIKENPGSALDQ